MTAYMQAERKAIREFRLLSSQIGSKLSLNKIAMENILDKELMNLGKFWRAKYLPILMGIMVIWKATA
ncbi:hypothetical protein DHD08_17950 [Arenibacter sp. H213]|nr:hypothetical protein [Arenibacter sp. H213]